MNRILALVAAFIIPSLIAQESIVQSPFDLDKYFLPSGWMGDGTQGERYLSLNLVFRGRPRPKDVDGLTTRIAYSTGPLRWAGIYWQYPESNWGAQPGRRVIGAKRISFWAAGETGRDR